MNKFLQKYKYFFLVGIILLGLFLRFYQLGINPPSLNWDEASTGYNAYSILKTGRDEYGNFIPLSIRSFDDYKPPLYTYLAVPSIAVFGLTDFAVRFPSAILGTFSIVIIYFLVLELFLKSTKKELGFDISEYRVIAALVAALFFAISPWSLQFSRAAYEGNIGLFFLITGLLFFLKAFKQKWYLFLSSLFLVLSMYSYHSFRLVVPFLLILMFILFFKQLWKMKTTVILALIVFAILVIPIFSSFFSTNAGTGSRLSMVTIFGPSPNLDQSIKELELDKKNGDIIGQVMHNRRIVYFLAVSKGYLDHYNPDFLFLHGDGGRQHHAVNMGMLYLIELPLLFLGFLVLGRYITRRKLILFGMLLIAPLPAAITTGTPHPVRAIAMLPELVILSSVGLVFLVAQLSHVTRHMSLVKYALFTILFSLFSINLIYYFHQYYVHTPVEYGDFWQYGYKEALNYAKENENKYDKIVVTYSYDQPYIYYLYYNKIDPSWFQQNWNFTLTGQMPRFERRIGKYDFRNINWGEDQKLKKTLFIGTQNEIPSNANVKLLDEIKFLDGSTAFRIAKT